MLSLFDLNQIAHHPQMSALITDEDEDMLSYMIHLEVRPGSLRLEGLAGEGKGNNLFL